MVTYDFETLRPAATGAPLETVSAVFAPNQTVLKGTALAIISAAAVNATFTITFSGSPTTGTFRISYNGEISGAISYSSTAATLAANIKSALEALNSIGVGNVTVTGTGPFTVTFVNELAGMPVTGFALHSQAVTGGTVAVAAGTTGVAGGRWVPYNGTEIAAPAANLTTYTAAASPTGSWGDGCFLMQHAWETSEGVSAPSPGVKIVVVDGESIQVGAINAANTPDEATYLRVYANGMQVARIAVASGAIAATNLTSPSAHTGASGAPPSAVGGAATNLDGSAIAKGFAFHDVKTDNKGRIIVGDTVADSALVVVGGSLKGADLIGVDDRCLRVLAARLILGSFSSGAFSSNAVVKF